MNDMNSTKNGGDSPVLRKGMKLRLYQMSMFSYNSIYDMLLLKFNFISTGGSIRNEDQTEPKLASMIIR